MITRTWCKSQGVSLLGSQPTEGNIRGGLSTIEEKAFGNVEKMGRCTVVGYLDQAEEPKGPGLYFMDSSSAAAEMVTLCCAAGAALHLFTTGQGNIVGNPILPVVKMSANPLTVETMSEHIDVDLTGLLSFRIQPGRRRRPHHGNDGAYHQRPPDQRRNLTPR